MILLFMQTVKVGKSFKGTSIKKFIMNFANLCLIERRRINNISEDVEPWSLSSALG